MQAQQLSCLGPDRLQAVRHAPDTEFRALYDACAAEFRSALGPAFTDLGDDALRAAFATVVSHHLMVYGASQVYDLPGLLARSNVDCAGSAALAWHLHRVAGGTVRRLKVVGWDHVDNVGNHAQLAYGRPGQEMILDPTIGLVARTSYADVLAARPVAPDRLASFPNGADDGLDVFRRGVIDDLYAGGAFTPATVIYEQPYPPGQGGLAEAASHEPDNTGPAPGTNAAASAEPDSGVAHAAAHGKRKRSAKRRHGRRAHHAKKR